MDLGESIFRSWIKFKKQRQKNFDSVFDTAVLLKEISDRLRYLGLMLSGLMFEIRGGTQKEEVRDYLVFPDSCSELSTREDNADLLIFRLVFYVTAFELEIHLPEGLDYPARHLFSIICSEKVLNEMKIRYPGIGVLADKLYRKVSETRPLKPKIQDAKDLYDVLTELRLKNISELSGELKIFESLWQKDSLPSKAQLKGVIEKINTVYPHKTLPQPVWLWGFTTNYRPAVSVSELPELKRREGEEKVFELNRTVHLQKWKETKKQSNPLFHSFEKTESVEDYGGENTSDAIEDMTEDEDAMKDLTLGSVIRTSETTRGLLKADVVDEGTEILVEKKSILSPGVAYTYPEWDYKNKNYRPDWCTLYELDQAGTENNFNTVNQTVAVRRAREVQEIRASLLRLLSSREARNRQLDGPEVDYDAVLERFADVTAGHSPTERLYLRQRKSIKDVSFLILLDTSLSTDGYIDGRRILDIEIESSLILAGAFEGYLDDEVAIAHFNSRTRNDCRFTYLKRFNREWSSLKKTVGTLEPDGYTRIGPAIRHAAKALAQTKARKKFLLIVSDGKPSDYDQYEGRYGVADVAQAIREARQLRITTFGLAVEHQTKSRLAEMFGKGRYHVLPKSSLLPGYMADIFLRAIV